jgi:hypothetical protein
MMKANTTHRTHRSPRGVLVILAVAASALSAADQPAEKKTPTSPAAKAPAKPVVQPAEVVHPPVRQAAPRKDARPRIVLKNDEAAGCLSISVDGAEAVVYRSTAGSRPLRSLRLCVTSDPP